MSRPRAETRPQPRNEVARLGGGRCEELHPDGGDVVDLFVGVELLQPVASSSAPSFSSR
jgi:hypothetical protein